MRSSSILTRTFSLASLACPNLCKRYRGGARLAYCSEFGQWRSPERPIPSATVLEAPSQWVFTSCCHSLERDASSGVSFSLLSHRVGVPTLEFGRPQGLVACCPRPSPKPAPVWGRSGSTKAVVNFCSHGSRRVLDADAVGASTHG